MRIQHSEKFNELLKKVESYIDIDGIRPDAPENIKKLYKEFIELGEKEYNAALL